MFTEHVTLVVGSEYARSKIAADTYAKLTAAGQRRDDLRGRRTPRNRIARLVHRIRLHTTSPTHAR